MAARTFPRYRSPNPISSIFPESPAVLESCRRTLGALLERRTVINYQQLLAPQSERRTFPS